MADLGTCGVCGRENANRTHQCRHCDDKMCTACANKAQGQGKCPNCGKGAAVRPNPDQ